MDEKAPPIIGEPSSRTVEVEVLPPAAGPLPEAQDMPRGAAKGRTTYRTAIMLAVVADAIQIGLFPVFGPGILSVADVVLDLVAFAVFWRLVGWHPALLPGFLFESVPIVDLAPTWTIAVWIAVKRNSRRAETPESPPSTGP